MKQEKRVWQKSRMELFQELECSEEGLGSQEAVRRRERFGPNELQSGGRKSAARIFLEQFADFLVIILILAAAVSAALGDVESMIVILAVITMNARFGHRSDGEGRRISGQLEENVGPHGQGGARRRNFADSGPGGGAR